MDLQEERKTIKKKMADLAAIETHVKAEQRSLREAQERAQVAARVREEEIRLREKEAAEVLGRAREAVTLREAEAREVVEEAERRVLALENR